MKVNHEGMDLILTPESSFESAFLERIARNQREGMKSMMEEYFKAQEKS